MAEIRLTNAHHANWHCGMDWLHQIMQFSLEQQDPQAFYMVNSNDPARIPRWRGWFFHNTLPIARLSGKHGLGKHFGGITVNRTHL